MKKPEISDKTLKICDELFRLNELDSNITKDVVIKIITDKLSVYSTETLIKILYIIMDEKNEHSM